MGQLIHAMAGEAASALRTGAKRMSQTSAPRVIRPAPKRAFSTAAPLRQNVKYEQNIYHPAKTAPSSQGKAFLAGAVAGGAGLATVGSYYYDMQDAKEIYNPALKKGITIQQELQKQLDDVTISPAIKDTLALQLLVSYLSGKILTNQGISVPCQVDYNEARNLIDQLKKSAQQKQESATIYQKYMGKAEEPLTSATDFYLNMINNTSELESNRMKRIKNEFIKQEKEIRQQALAGRYR